MGNEAIVRGALEAGVQFVSTYPGTPASEIGDSFSAIKKEGAGNFYFEYSINEKVAMEAGMGASLSGKKTLIAMKHFGLNVASDSFIPFVYTGTGQKGPTVVVVADDPSCHSSAQSEEDTRSYAELAHIPILEPSEPSECKEFVRRAFDLSEKYLVPIMIRLTTRVSHQRAAVNFGSLPPKSRRVPRFEGDKKQFVTLPPRILELKEELLKKEEKIRKLFSEKTNLNFITNKDGSNLKKLKGIGVITSGVSYLYTLEALEAMGICLPVLKIGVFHPFPKDKAKNFIKNKKLILVIEELEPHLENKVLEIAGREGVDVKVKGKKLIPQTGEIRPEDAANALSKITGRKNPLEKRKVKIPSPVKRTPRFCSGCAYWKVFSVVSSNLPKNAVVGGDIGCYMMASFPPYNLYDYMYSMGSSVGVAHGIKKAIEKGKKQKVVAFIGDSTFFHAGIPALINAVHNGSDILTIIMDNRITAMTGHQPYPGIEMTGKKTKGKAIDLEKLVKALGAENVSKIDPARDIDKFEAKVKEFINKKGVSVIIARHPCWLYYEKRGGK